jgi:hypothetical protein
MKQVFLFAFSVVALLACNGSNSNNQDHTSFGAALNDSTGLAPLAALQAFEAGNTEPVVLQGTISQVCQAEGCWFNMELDSNRRLFVEFGDAFTVPKDIAGKQALVAGSFYRDSISVERQRENAKADGASEAKINAITTPLVEVNFKAGGVTLLR